ncbi:MAG: RNA 2',3'-cyclic phosphodiesterase [Myxococcaceae bacterium]
MRTFIAITLERELNERLQLELTRLAKLAPEARWAWPDSLHLTVAFLGEIPDASVPAVGATLGKVASQHEPFTLSARGSGTFGPLDAPKVLWVGIGGNVEALLEFQRELTVALAPLGVAPDHEVYTPHVTLARAKHPRGDASLGRCGDTFRDSVFGDLLVTNVALLSSQNDHDRMRYTVLERHVLG